jgi:hypothetical protein
MLIEWFLYMHTTDNGVNAVLKIYWRVNFIGMILVFRKGMNVIVFLMYIFLNVHTQCLHKQMNRGKKQFKDVGTLQVYRN